jgi:hypothetical protein
MKSSILTFFLSLILATTLAHGAVILVGPGQSAQTAVDGASNGDIIRVMPGNFGDLVIVDKNLTIRKHSTTPPVFGNIEVNGSKVKFIGIEATNLTARDNSNPTKLEVVQGYYSGLIDFNATEGNFLYAGIRRLIFTGKGNVVGCDLNGNSQGGIGISIEGAGTTLSVRNSHIHDYAFGHTGNIDEVCIGIRVKNGAHAEILNNIIADCKDSHRDGQTSSNTAKGILVKNDAGEVIIMGNLIMRCMINYKNSKMIKAPLGTVFRHNKILPHGGYGQGQQASGYEGGVVGVDIITDSGDPKLNANNTLQADSPCINAGPPDPQYNDRDGSRNDIGMFGGHNFIPDGRTTNKPIVLGLDVAPIAVPTGGTVTIESTGATVK